MMTAEDKSIYGQIKTKGEQLAELVKMAENIQNNNDKNAAEAYHRGLDDAWEAAKKIFGYEMDGGIPINELGKAFGYAEDAIFCTADIIRHNTASEAIAKLKAYEDKQKAADEIKVGDEVKQVTESGEETGLRCTVTAIDGDCMNGYSQDGRAIVCSSQVNRWWKKTGRHFDIDKILEAMKHD